MVIWRALFAAISLLALPELTQAEESAKAEFINIDGRRIGWADLVAAPNGVLINAYLSGLSTGAHGFHIHEVGKCNVADGFRSAGGHFAARDQSHGYLHSRKVHLGDMPNQFVQGDGILRVELFNPNVSLGPGETSLFDSDGSAIVVHANADDYKSQPAGNAGSRIACAVIEKP